MLPRPDEANDRSHVHSGTCATVSSFSTIRETTNFQDAMIPPKRTRRFWPLLSFLSKVTCQGLSPLPQRPINRELISVWEDHFHPELVFG